MARLDRWCASPRVSGLVIGLVAIAVYAGTLTSGFVYDDNQFILNNAWLRDVRHIGDIFGSHFAGFDPEYTAIYYRPLMHVLNLGLYQAFGPQAWVFHLVSVLLHSGVSVLVFVLTYRLLGEDPDSGRGETSRDVPAAFLAALLFAVHPVHTESVAWIAGITDVSMALFYLLSFVAYVRWARAGSHGLPWVSGAMFFVALLCKEPALTLPVLVIAYDKLFLGVAWSRLAARMLHALRPHGVALGVYLGLRLAALGSFAPAQAPSASRDALGAIDALALFARYAGKLLLPTDLNVLYIYRAVSSPFEPRVLVACGLVVLVAVGVYFGRKRPTPGLGLFLAIVSLLPALYISGLGESVFAERYLYLPSVGLAFIVAWALRQVAAASARHFVTVALIVLAVAGLGAIGTVARNRAWHDSESLWTDTVLKSPDSAAAHEFLGNVRLSQARVEDAIEQFEASLDLDPTRPGARLNLGNAYAAAGRVDDAIEQYLAALRRGIGVIEAHNNLGLAYARKGWFDRAIEHYVASLRLDPLYAEAHNNLGVAYWQRGDWSAALEQFEAAARLDPEHPTYAQNAAMARGAVRAPGAPIR